MAGTHTVVVGVSGGIAAYKAVQVVRSLVLAGHDVHVLPTAAALRFVGLATWEAISRNPVRTDVWDDVSTVAHVDLGRRADAIVVAPATAHTLSRLAAGAADDPLTVTALASTAPLVVAPAMHPAMWRHPATQHSMTLLRERGATVVGPADGPLTGDDSGPGRMSEPAEIVAAVLDAAAPRPHDLAGLSVLVTAGGTREPLDPVRFLGNRSSGRQGIAIAEAARARGADATLVAGHVEVPLPTGERLEVVRVSTADELATAAVDAAATADVAVMAAAVADFRLAQPLEQKIKKDAAGDGLTLQLVPARDTLAEVLAAPVAGRVVVGFAAETATGEELLAAGRAKLARKPVDLLAVNRVGWTETFGAATNAVSLLAADGTLAAELAGTKREVADGLWDAVVRLRDHRAV
ncbi:bifunctional phosphopantothenoylcysteine decarboxylase/phosphopantothenate--cysteine ligase CoaBC [Microbacterium sp. Marseille-Q6648]|uniref:bifunctional phosphopantothenoylcysteine decarboxylase/phosphopantothenate--cysteine ligase CoaBC n=1 Tax=Microbacterium sp. Marseille-Q6648 TaxID=2937991 RepID=UPI00203AB239|nr:bifunctional phosphopantothenoylcysteine decarboxylase/phosphopantothenate--cysteine ligase CoaBC [Microbacterium sp. Marseille-Q6648]